MGIQDLQTFLENEGVGVDLFRIARNQAGGFRLVLDAEGCLDRLYGGFFSDWACGGQWARCVQFLTTLAQALAEHQVPLCVCFNGAHPAPPATPQHWIQTQATYRQRVNSVLRHIVMKGTPPPKVWWVPPTGLHSCLRTALRYLNIPIMVSSDDHCQEVVGLCREKSYAGLVGCSGEYLVFQPPRYFSSSQLKLTYRSSLETKEYMVHELPKVLDVPQDRLCLMAALLGGTILSEHSLTDFYKRLGITQKKQVPPETLVKTVCQFVRELPSSDVDAACIEIFGDLNDLRAAKLKQAVQYYLNGTKDGFLKYRTASGRRPKTNKKNQKPDISPQSTSMDLDTSKLATETSENEQKGLEDYKLATANASMNADFNTEEATSDVHQRMSAMTLDGGDASAAQPSKPAVNDKNDKPAPATKENRQIVSKQLSNDDNCPPAPAEVLRTCAERHARGLMHPHMLSILSHRQIALPVLMEDDHHREIPSIHHFYRPIRQNVYAILYNMHHHRFMAQKAKEDGQPTTSASANNDRPCTVQISEWIYSRVNPGKNAEMVPGVCLDWPVPTVQRLWFGTAQDDKCRRMRAFLSCMRSDTPLMLNTSYVPQHLLILGTVLRFIMTSQIQILRRQELDAFLATAFSSDLMNALHLQEMTVNGISSRGVQLGALVMAGAEAALMANDACGAPVPWLVAAPWLYFDGKLLQRNLHRANHCKHLAQLCDNHLDTVVKVERMRKAILEGLEVEFAMAPLPLVAGVVGGALGGWGRGRGRGARLEIAGVVVGQWGGGSYPQRAQRYPQQQVSYVGYTPPTRNSYGGRGWRGARGGRGRGRGRGAAPARGGRRTRRDEPEQPVKPTTLTVNGKTVRPEDIATQVEEGSPHEDNSAADNEVEGAQPQKTKTAKNMKKNIGKGKKKSSNPKTDAQLEVNGPLDKNKVTAE
ncbi:constitutive coactivator of PPAR-gamma-like protein 1 isoform X2 [Ostrinia furnacalis]|uniref:constitutive coactivator of PPAR-gamma-like protein 1 isoform X1 n=1 Tax=Ostrinia furnacalis TaxID=93504 RepID=UPI00103A71A3|nr:constitutive coactivator of PPAR-gamma-like protein 1 isoform X1 [Ostrinia furnacalis]XP_028158538.1 constitutive coactivator of PPAR-gamma-like protein 1 isoform X2 [Ostrinia furnacalis]